MQNKPPTFEDSPAFKWFPRPENGRISGRDAKLYWSYVDGFTTKIRHFAVSYFPLDRLRKLDGYVDHPIWQANGAVFNRKIYSGSSGNCISGWMQDGNVMPPPPHDEDSGSRFGFSPDGDFACLKAFGFETIESAKAALKQFSHIEECEWARDGSVDPATLLNGKINDDLIARQIREIERDIQQHEYDQNRKKFYNLVNQKIQSGEWIVPKGFMILDGGGYCANIADLPFSPKCHAYKFCNDWDELKQSIFGNMK